jgi:hypothetical protein
VQGPTLHQRQQEPADEGSAYMARGSALDGAGHSVSYSSNIA